MTAPVELAELKERAPAVDAPGLVVVEGMPGVGKTNAAIRLALFIGGVFLPELSAGEHLRLAAPARYHANDAIKRALADHARAHGCSVVADRWYFSTIIYHLALRRQREGRNGTAITSADRDDVRSHLDRIGGEAPDAVFLVGAHAPLDVSVDRGWPNELLADLGELYRGLIGPMTEHRVIEVAEHPDVAELSRHLGLALDR